VVVVEGATLATFVTGTITMLIVGVLLNIVGLGIFCWALFALATHALPFFVGMTVGIYSFQAGAGPFAIVVGFVAAGFTFVVGRYTFSVARSPIIRLVIGLLFAVPAAPAGYSVTLALAHLGIPSEWWREAFVCGQSPLTPEIREQKSEVGERLALDKRAGQAEYPIFETLKT